MHYADFAQARLREIDELVTTTEGFILNGMDHDKYQQNLARRRALLEARSLIVDALGRNETGHPQSR